jgi:hypothetical protein
VMTPRSSCPGGEYYSSPGRSQPLALQNQHFTATPWNLRNPFDAPRFERGALFPGEIGPPGVSSGSPKISYTLAGSVLESRGGLLFASAEASLRNSSAPRAVPQLPLRSQPWRRKCASPSTPSSG